jgi:putative ABC transport system substrate-binding protein
MEYPDAGASGRRARRRVLRSLAVGAASLALPLRAQSPAKLPVVGFLASGGPDTQTSLRRKLAELGWIDGRTVVIELRAAYGNPELMPAFARELVSLKVDVLCASGPPGVRAAVAATRTIPIVAFDLETDPVAAGLVASLARPGGNVTGLFLDIPGVAGKWLELILQAAPGRVPIGLLWDATTGEWQLKAARDAARRMGLELRVVEMRRGDDIEPGIRASVASGTRAMAMLSSPTISGRSKDIAVLAQALRLPAVSPFRAFAQSGGLMSYGPDLDDFRAQMAPYVDRLLKGARAGDMPIQQPARYEFVVNAATAKALGLALPQALMLRADRVIG